MENMELWNQVRQPPRDALKEIRGGRLNGKTDISPQWRYQVITEILGPCGKGWKYTVDRKWREEGSDGQVMAFADISLYLKFDEEWSDPIPGTGGAMLVEKEKAGLHTSDEGYKMAVTDALSTALKMVGVAADIYRGFWDGSKYRHTGNGNGSQNQRPPANQKQKGQQPPKEGQDKKGFYAFLDNMKTLKQELGEEEYYSILGSFEYTHANEVKNRNQQVAIYRAMQSVLDERNAA